MKLSDNIEKKQTLKDFSDFLTTSKFTPYIRQSGGRRYKADGIEGNICLNTMVIKFHKLFLGMRRPSQENLDAAETVLEKIKKLNDQGEVCLKKSSFLMRRFTVVRRIFSYSINRSFKLQFIEDSLRSKQHARRGEEASGRGMIRRILNNNKLYQQKMNNYITEMKRMGLLKDNSSIASLMNSGEDSHFLIER